MCKEIRCLLYRFMKVLTIKHKKNIQVGLGSILAAFSLLQNWGHRKYGTVAAGPLSGYKYEEFFPIVPNSVT